MELAHLERLEAQISAKTAKFPHSKELRTWHKEKKKLLAKIEDTQKSEFSLKKLRQKWLGDDILKDRKDITFLMRMACLVPSSTAVS